MYNIVFDLGGTIIKAGLIRDGRIIALDRFASHSINGIAHSTPLIEDRVEHFMSEHDLQPEQISGIGFAFPGLVNVKNNTVISTNQKYDDATSFDFTGWAWSKWGLPVVVDNDARLAVTGEWQYGAAKGFDNVVMMTIGTGIGSGVVMEGRILYGAHFQAGILGGHFTINYNGRKCSCGSQGCVESQASSFFLGDIISSHPDLSPEFKMRKGVDFETLFTEYKAGDREARIVCQQCMDVWSAALVTYIHAYDPEVIVVGGGVMRSADVILPYIGKKVEALAWCPSGTVPIRVSQLGDDAALMGLDYRLKQLA